MSVENKNAIIENCSIHHVTVQARDWAASLRLYRDVLGMEVVAEFGPPGQKIVLLDVGDGGHIELKAPTADTPQVGSAAANDPLVHVALATSDAPGALEHVRQAGYEITLEPKTVGVGDMKVTVAFFRGPNGEDIEFFQVH